MKYLLSEDLICRIYAAGSEFAKTLSHCLRTEFVRYMQQEVVQPYSRCDCLRTEFVRYMQRYSLRSFALNGELAEFG